MTLNDHIICVQLARLGLKAVAADDRHTAGDIARAAASVESADKHAVEWKQREADQAKNAEHSQP
jgi:hypothetical protein